METQTQYREGVEISAAIVLRSGSLPEQAIFRKEGEYWTVGRGGNAFRLKHTKGFGYLAHLLRHPAGEMLDEQAKVAYRHRLSDLREELEEAKTAGNVDRAEQAEQEIDALTSELSRAVGLGGRNRRSVSASERARQSISKTIKSVLERIVRSDATLGDIL